MRIVFMATGEIALSYLYVLPENMSQMIPAACLFATVFTLRQKF